ncbi:MAG: efflux RND transporter permease subunit [Syntrophales bacterium]|nr:efflux RND transporter permease subunit [Syntrophales bacterium]MDD5642483.1 efflux RND transporter permease subunit [Syntrophales bacterium]
MNKAPEDLHLGPTARLVKVFLLSKLPTIIILVSLLAGVAALLYTPREEDPQIKVPMVDILIRFPGASPEEVENLVVINLEKKLWEMEGLEDLYSQAQENFAVVTAKFKVGEDLETSLFKVYNKVFSNIDQVPSGVTGWVVKPMNINDVPIVTLALYSNRADDYSLRRVADEMLHRLQSIPDTGRSYVVSGRKRQVRVVADPTRLAGHNLDLAALAKAIEVSNVNVPAGRFSRQDREYLVEAGPFLKSAEEVANLVVGVHQGKPVYLKDVAQVIDGPEEPVEMSTIAFGPADELPPGYERGKFYPAVTMAVAKRRGTNAVTVAEGILHKVKELQEQVIPPDIRVKVTRNYGATADEKVNELIRELLIAVLSITVLLTLFLGWREALIVALAVPLTLAITLTGNMLFGYTINRVTLFALILSLGLLVDDPIIDVENIHRHFQLREHPPLEATLVAVDEVRAPTILATFTVIISFIPMYFVTGMMGPYMRPMPLNVPLAMLMSLGIAFTVTPWATYYLLKKEYGKEEKPFVLEETWVYRTYTGIMKPLLDSRRKSHLFLLGVMLLFVVSVSLPVLGLVPLKMLPFDNKNDFLIVADLPNDTPLESTQEALKDLSRYLTTVAEVDNVVSFAGGSAPIDFNGLVRHYYLMQGPWVGQLRINLTEKERRHASSHDVTLWIRPALEEIAKKYQIRLKIAEVPPGPPVLQTLVAEVYGPPGASYAGIIKEAERVKGFFLKTAGVVDVDTTVETPEPRFRFLVDRQKAALSGLSQYQIARGLAVAEAGENVGRVHVPTERLPLEIFLRGPLAWRSSTLTLGQLYFKTPAGAMTPLQELGHFDLDQAPKSIMRKNLERVVFVTGDTAGASPVNAILDLMSDTQKAPPPPGYRVNFAGEGEWKITVQVFRDLGLAFAGALVGIYILLVLQTSSYTMPLVIMVAIPLTMIGVMPGFALLNLLFASPVKGFANPIYFTATAMIGVIALAGIVVRNSIILIDFIHHHLDKGVPLEEAVLKAGAVRFRPILLTALAAMFGSWVITLDPIFSGLAWSFIFGLFASTAFSLVVVPVIFYLQANRKQE